MPCSAMFSKKLRPIVPRPIIPKCALLIDLIFTSTPEPSGPQVILFSSLALIPFLRFSDDNLSDFPDIQKPKLAAVHPGHFVKHPPSRQDQLAKGPLSDHLLI